ncbi:GGDEF domain-containing response regulator [Pseudoxanthomonas gei]|uniref:GGDEF domain-containing response regulator n=1 Tax=Pseudoxanthomonas gei TaxID=1383030 RepID=UPI001B871C8E|nr:diguanylate cyclase [Pseudoxanthomonas gei]
MEKKSIILCVDDDSTVLNALRTMLSSHFGPEVQVEFAESGDEALEIAAELHAQGGELGLVISDFMMPGLRGDELLVKLHEASANTVKILLTGQSDMSGVKRAINEANLYRFLEKPFLNDDIVLTVRAALRAYWQERDLIRHNEELRRMNAELEDIVAARTEELVEKNRLLEVLSVTDKLTGLYNRRKLDELLEEEIVRAQRYQAELSVIMLDIDRFKRVNDTYGHGAGDEVLIEVAGLLRRHTRDADVLGRLGGEEFLLVCPHSSAAAALGIAVKLRDAMAAHPFPIVGQVTSSFGIASCRPDDTAAALLARADAALYRAKGAGRNRVELENA